MPRRLALIIGNNDYQKDPLKNCVNDANSLARVFRNVNFEVELRTNLNSEDMYQCIKSFIQTIKPNDMVVFFFAGHGVQWGDQNFLLPCDNQKITTGRDMQRFATNAQEDLDEMASMTPHFILFLLDCCRVYWIPSAARSMSNPQQVGGLNGMNAPPGTLIAYACAARKTAADESSEGTNGIFTKYLLKHIATSGMDIELVLRKVATDVAVETNQSQIPYRVSSIRTENLYLVPTVIDESSSTSIVQHNITSPSIISSINILLIGEEGVGKSTFINAFVNYLSFPTVAQINQTIVLKPLAFYLTVNDLFEERSCIFGDFHEQDPSATSRCQTYTFHPRLTDGKKLCLIDTPSLKDAQEFDQDNTDIIQHILDYVDTLSHLNAVCFLLQPDASRLFTSFHACFGRLIHRLGRSVRNNVIFCFTNALATSYTPGSTAPLLRSMFASHSMNDMPFNRENTFFFENESFRYLVAAQNGIQFNTEEEVEYMMTWSESVKESRRLLDCICQRAVYRIVKK